MRANKIYSSTLSVIALFFLSGAVNLHAVDDDKYKDVVIKTIEVRDGIYMLMGAGGNIGVSVG